MDALQGRAGGPKQRPTLKPIIRNDNMIFRVTIEKKNRSKTEPWFWASFREETHGIDEGSRYDSFYDCLFCFFPSSYCERRE